MYICELCEETGSRHHVYPRICRSCVFMLEMAGKVARARAGDSEAKADLRRRGETIANAGLWVSSWLRAYPILENAAAMADPTIARPEPRPRRLDGRPRYAPSRDRQAGA